MYRTCVIIWCLSADISQPLFAGLTTMTIQMMNTLKMNTLKDDRQGALIAAARRIDLVPVRGTDANDLTPKIPILPTPLNAARGDRQSTRR